MKTYNILLTTIGRPSLTAMVDSIYPQLNECDYLTIVCDCKMNDVFPLIYEHIANAVCTVNVIQNSQKLGYYGHGSRNRWQDYLQGDYILHADDDDTYYPDAMEKVRRICTEEKLYIFQMLDCDGRLIPNTGCNEIEHRNIGTPCGVIPNMFDMQPFWGLHYGGDFGFYNRLSTMVKEVVFVNELIYKVR